MADDYVAAVEPAVRSSDLVLMHLKYSFLVGIGAFMLLFPFYRSRKSLFDGIAARNISRFLKFSIFAEMGCIALLYYFYVVHGAAITLHAGLNYGNNDSWLYGFGRPTGSMIFMGVGIMANTHPAPRYVCMIAACVEVLCAAMSAVQIRDLYDQTFENGSPANGYSSDMLLIYYWVDVVSLGIATLILLQVSLLSVVCGWCNPQFIHPSVVQGDDADRIAVMRDQRYSRRAMNVKGDQQPRNTMTLPSYLKDLNAARDKEREEKAAANAIAAAAKMEAEAAAIADDSSALKNLVSRNSKSLVDRAAAAGGVGGGQSKSGSRASSKNNSPRPGGTSSKNISPRPSAFGNAVDSREVSPRGGAEGIGRDATKRAAGPRTPPQQQQEEQEQEQERNGSEHGEDSEEEDGDMAIMEEGSLAGALQDAEFIF